MISVSDRVVVSDKQLFGNQSILTNGEVISIAGSIAKVAVEGEEVPRFFPVDSLQSHAEVFGANYVPNDNQVINAIRRR